MADIAALQIRVTSDGIERETGGLNALAAGATKAETATTSLERSSKRLDTTSTATAGSVTRAAQATNVAGRNLTTVATASDKAAAGNGRLTSSFANASFQIQDFAVQVASGQSALIAFTQQFPQLASAFSFSGAIGLAGVALGTFVAVGAAVLPLLFDMEDRAKKLNDTVEGLSKSFDVYSAATERASRPTAALEAQFGTSAETAGKLYEAMRRLAELDFAKRMTETRDAIAGSLGSVEDAINRIDDIFANRNSILGRAELTRALADVKAEIGLTEEQARAAQTAINQLKSATTVSGQTEAAQRLADILSQARDASGQLPAEFQAAAQALYQAAIYGLQFNEAVKNGSESEKEAVKSAQEKTQEYLRQAELTRTIATFGENSAQVEALKRQEALETVNAYIRQNEITGQSADNLRNAALAAHDATAATNSWASAMDGVKAKLEGIAGVLSAIGGGVMDRVSIAAQNRALDAGLSASEARKAGQRAQEDLRLQQQRATLVGSVGSTAGNFLADFQQSELNGRREAADALERRYASLAETARTTKRETASAGREANAAAREAEQAVESYNRIVSSSREFIAQQQLEAQALGMTEEAANRLRYEQDLLNEAANDNIKLTAAQRAEIAGLATQMAATEAETTRLRDAFNFAKDATGGFISDLRNGLKNGEGFFKSFADAASNLLDKVINKIQDELVNAIFSVSKAGSGGGGGFLSSLFGGLFGGGGGAFPSRPGVGLYAKGDAFENGISGYSNQIVSKPTMFAFAKGAGLMGEAGPEAIMPLTRDSSGRLGVRAQTGNGYAANQNGGTSTVMIQLSPELVGQILEQAQGQSVEIVRQNNQAKDTLYQNGAAR